MKKALMTTLIAAPLLSLSSLSFAAEPVLLDEAQMDGVTAGFFDEQGVDLTQVNISPVTVVQLSLLNEDGGDNNAFVLSGNFADVEQTED